jgi:hypothetical protein
MTKREHFDLGGELTEQELTSVTGGAEPIHNRKSPLARARSEVKDSHDRYANVEVAYLR